MSSTDHFTPEQNEGNQVLVDSAIDDFLAWSRKHNWALLIGRHYGLEIALSDSTRQAMYAASNKLEDKNLSHLSGDALMSLRGFDPKANNIVFASLGEVRVR